MLDSVSREGASPVRRSSPRLCLRSMELCPSRLKSSLSRAGDEYAFSALSMLQEGLEGCEEIVALLERSIDDALQEGSLICYKPPSPDLLPARLETERQQKLSSLHSQLAALRQAWHSLCPLISKSNESAAVMLFCLKNQGVSGSSCDAWACMSTPVQCDRRR